ncbi:tetratricopeptide repeat protein [Legionella worsleiensis]|uniref:TPR repeat protein n=1 Tax=Legionella worsleiensis TaxID=45076 RepID=A0A0W1ALC3_9GAMM|nr:SEL1-like repeat protein [Legionella worsleiensis]KTD82082.1 TPR repeat protein [Legionella worsleiensis]STY31501.1 TPR repeat protein [Legionella worsleiensis]
MDNSKSNTPKIISKIYEQQRTIIIAAITNYLAWRNNKSAPDNRGYIVTFFTYLRHFTPFGENRATQLHSFLSDNPLINPMSVLRTHLMQNSRLMNHSLDTYILEALIEHRELFLINEEITELRSYAARADLRQLILLHKTRVPHAEYAFNIGLQYERSGSDDALQKACYFYALAMQLNHPRATKALKQLADHGNSDAQYSLGCKFYHPRGAFSQAIHYCLRAAEQHHLKATAYLNNANFDEQHYLHLAHHYEQKNNIPCAISFYEKALALESQNAALRLGELHDPFYGCTLSASSSQVIAHERNALKAFHYFKAAAEQLNERGLSSMVSLAKQLNDDDLYWQTGLIYFHPFGSLRDACLIFKYLIDKNAESTIEQINTLLAHHADLAYTMGKLYERNIDVSHHLEKALEYYVVAMKSGHAKAQIIVEYCATKGVSHAQYLLGVAYHHPLRQFSEAIEYCLAAAEQHHVQAIAYLNNTSFDEQHYLTLAQHFERKQDMRSALSFYEKALLTYNADAAFRLGELYDPFMVSGSLEKDASKSFNYYRIAAKKKHEKAFFNLQRLANELDDDLFHYSIAQLYLDEYEDLNQALACFIRLAEKNVGIAIDKLRELTLGSPLYAHRVGRLYEDNTVIEHHMQKAGFYYLLASQQNNELYNHFFYSFIDTDKVSSEELNNLALLCVNGSEHIQPDPNLAYQCFEKIIQRQQSNDSQSKALAHYHLGLLLLGHSGAPADLVHAAKHFILAEAQGAQEATVQLETLISSTRLNAQHFMDIANLYFGELHEMKTNWPRVVRCYKHASAKGDHSAKRWLAQAYQVDHVDVPRNDRKSFKFYFQLASSGDRDAFPPLERLGGELDSREQKLLSQLFKNVSNNEKAVYWQERAEEAEGITLILSTGL